MLVVLVWLAVGSRNCNCSLVFPPFFILAYKSSKDVCGVREKENQYVGSSNLEGGRCVAAL